MTTVLRKPAAVRAASAAQAGVSKKVLKQLGVKQIGEEAMGITEYQLSNGLKILLVPNHSAPVVTFMQLFRVGSRDEGVGHTGATHFLEHMMFKGTRKFDPAKGLDSTELFNRIGAVSNATTWFDRTNYFEAVPAEYLEFCVKVEADRMRNLRLRQEDRDAEMSVVRNELERGENSPDEAMEKEMYAIAFREHPYHHTTIGWRSDVENVPMAKLKSFYDVFYWPNNCTVVIVGDFQPETALKLVKRYYGKIPKSPKPIPEMYTVEPPQEGERRYNISRVGDLPRVWVGFHTPASTHADHYAINVAGHVLGGSSDRSSRLYRLVEEGLCVDIHTRHDELRDPALLMIAATLTPGASPEVVEREILAELDKLAHHGVSDAELEPIRSANRKGSILARSDQMELAFAIGESEARADWRWLVEFDAKFEAVTSADITRVVSTYCVKDNRTVGYFQPQVPQDEEAASNDEGGDEGEEETSGKTKVKPAKVSASDMAKILSPATGKARASFASQVKRTVLSNGMVVNFMPTPGVGSVAVSASLRAGNIFEPDAKSGLADVVAEMLSRGAEGLSKVELAQLLKSMGVVEGLHFGCDPYSVQFGSTVVASDLGEYLKAASTLLRHPLFAVDELERLKLEWRSKIAEQRNNPGPVAVNKLFQSIYPVGHLFHQPDFDQQLAELNAISSDDLKRFHHGYYSPAGMILTIVGDVEESQALALVHEYFGGWSGQDIPGITLPAVEMPAAGSRIEARLADKASMQLLMGHILPVKRTDPDFYPLYIANLALGGDTIIARLGRVVREQHGLTYGIYSELGDTTHGWAPWTISLSVNPENASKALGLVNDVLTDYRAKGVTRDEVTREASGAAGLFKVSMRSAIAIARVLTRFESLGLGAEGADDHARRILAVKKSEVDEAIRRYLHPDRMVTVLAGTF